MESQAKTMPLRRVTAVTAYPADEPASAMSLRIITPVFAHALTSFTEFTRATTVLSESTAPAR